MMLKTLLVESLMTGMFVAFVLQIVKHNGSEYMPLNTLAIGLALYASIQISSGISGGAINPAVGAVQTVFQKLFNSFVYPKAEASGITYLPIYLAGPTLGGIFGGLFQRLINETAISRGEKAAG